MLTQGWRIRAAFAVVLVCGAVLGYGALFHSPLLAKSCFASVGTSNDHSNGHWTIWRNRRGARSVPVIVMAPRQPSQGSHWLISYGWRRSLWEKNCAAAIWHSIYWSRRRMAIVWSLRYRNSIRRLRSVVLLADHRDGQPLSTAEGPLRLVVPDEKRHARWVRQGIVYHTPRPVIRAAHRRSGVLPGARYPGLTGRRETPDQQRFSRGDHHITGFDHSIDAIPAVRCNRSAGGNDRDDFGPTGQLHRHLRIHSARSDVFDTAFQVLRALICIVALHIHCMPVSADRQDDWPPWDHR